MDSGEKIFEVNDKDMQELIKYIKEVLQLTEGDNIIAIDNIWRVIIAKKQ